MNRTSEKSYRASEDELFDLIGYIFDKFLPNLANGLPCCSLSYPPIE